MSSLAGKIRSSLESDQYDLAGYTESRVVDLVNSAFIEKISRPVTHKTMISFKFVVGGGKLVRAKYDDNLPKYMTQALKNIEFSDDNSAAETIDSQGKFKFQHDTGQNLKFIIVYPKLDIQLGDEPNQNHTDSSTLSPEDLIRTSDLESFRKNIQVKIPTWKQRKHVIELLKEMKNEYVVLEQQMIKGLTLSGSQQETYSTTNDSFDEKILFIQEIIKNMIDSQNISASDKVELLKQLDTNITNCTDTQKKSNLTKRHEFVTSIQPKEYKFSKHDDIVKLRVKLMQMDVLEEKKRQGNLTISELATLETKTSILEEINQLEEISKGWFLDEADFLNMRKSTETDAMSRFRSMKNKASTGSSSQTKSSTSKPLGNNSSVFQFSKNSVKTGYSSNVNAKKKTTGFAAAFGDDDDD